MRSFAGVSYSEALESTRKLVPALRERAARSEALRALPQETINDLHGSGVLRAMQPKRWGGMELELTILLRLVVALVLTGVLGWERETVGKAAGLRTHMLVGFGATGFAMRRTRRKTLLAQIA